MEVQQKIDPLKNRLIEIYNRDHPPERDGYMKVLDKVNSVLKKEDNQMRPYDSSGLPGGFVFLKQNISTIIIPDIHSRMDLFLNIMFYKDSEGTVLEKLAQDTLQVLCVGDGIHAERRGAKRWAEAYEEFNNDYVEHEKIDQEMKEGFGVMEMIMEIKSNFPLNFHFLKGNHENISNEEGGGNHPFLKFSDEGAMVASYVTKFYGDEFMNKYYLFEKGLPVFAAGKNFLISHAEPEMFYDKEEIIEYRNQASVVAGLTWTDNDAALPGSVSQMIEEYIDKDLQSTSYYFGGHRPVNKQYNLRADGRYVQIHNPEKFIIALIKPDKEINLDEDIIELEDNTNNIINQITE